MSAQANDAVWRDWTYAQAIDMSDGLIDVFVGTHAFSELPFAIKIGEGSLLWLAQSAASQLVYHLVAAVSADDQVEYQLPAVEEKTSRAVFLHAGRTDTAHGLQVTLRAGASHTTVILLNNSVEVLLAGLRRVIKAWLDANGEVS